jgi:hypothetical protein
VLQKAFLQVRLLHTAFLVTWFLLIFVIVEIIEQGTLAGSAPPFLPIILSFVCLSEIGVALVFRARFIGEAETILRGDPENTVAIAKWRTGNLFSFCVAETIALFGFVLRFMGFGWNVAGAFFVGGLIMLLLWTPRKIQALPRGVR